MDLITEIEGYAMSDDHDHRPWTSATQGTRVLIECPASSSPSIVADVVRRHGFDVRTCEGPCDRGACDLLDHGTCALVSGADVVVNLLGAADPAADDVLGAVLAERRPPACVVERTPERLRLDRDGRRVPAGRRRPTTIVSPVTSRDLIRGVYDAIESRERSVPWWGDGYS